MAVFRVERTRDYTVMCNHHLKDGNLSLKAKGLLSMMLSLPDEWNYTTRGLAAICKEGVDAIGKRRNLCWSSSKANRPKNVHTKQRPKRARKRSFDMNITFEERQLMSLYNTGTRTGLIAALEEMRGYLAADETELRELTDSAIAKLRRMSDAEYDALDLFPDFEKEDMDAE